MHLVIIIPAYNEASVIGDLLSRLPRALSGITKITPIVVDDNSNDGTQGVVQASGVMCIRHQSNLGAGGATVTGFEAAKRLKADIVVTMDGDNQHDPDEIEVLIRPIVLGQADVVIGSRLKGASTKAMPVYKRLGNNALNIVTFAFFRIWVSDSQSGYKAFSREALKQIELRTTGYEFCSEICGEIKRKKLRLREVPIRTIYTDYSRKKGQLALNAVNIVLGLLLSKIR